MELIEQLPDIDAVFVTVGGGGLIAGMATYLKAKNPAIKVVGCLPEHSAEMYHCVQAGKYVPIQSQPTISDGSAGGFEEGSITLSLCQKLVDDWSLVSEDEIKDALRHVVHTHHKMIEGAAAVAVASFMKHSKEYQGKKVAILICGANIAPATLKEIL